MMLDFLGKVLCSSIKNLFENQTDIFDFTPQTGETEWNLGHHLANEIYKYIFWLNCDVDVTKGAYGNKRPDMIFHKRGSNDLNFLVVELKHRGEDPAEDIDKIKYYWRREPLSYRYGASVNITSPDDFDVIIFHNDGETRFDRSSDYMQIVNVSETDRKPFSDLVESIYGITGDEGYTDPDEVEELQRRLDGMVLELYG